VNHLQIYILLKRF